MRRGLVPCQIRDGGNAAKYAKSFSMDKAIIERFIGVSRGGIFPLETLFDDIDNAAHNALPFIDTHSFVRQWRNAICVPSDLFDEKTNWSRAR